MRRAFVSRRRLVAGVSRLGQLGFGAGEAVGQLSDLAGELEHGPVLLLHVTLEEGQTLFEIMKPGIHGRNIVGPEPEARSGHLSLAGEVETAAVATEEARALGRG